MGEIADDMINGASCSDCGMYFRNPANPNGFYEHGYPVICKECWDMYSDAEKKACQIQVATAELLGSDDEEEDDDEDGVLSPILPENCNKGDSVLLQITGMLATYVATCVATRKENGLPADLQHDVPRFQVTGKLTNQGDVVPHSLQMILKPGDYILVGRAV